MIIKNIKWDEEDILEAKNKGIELPSEKTYNPDDIEYLSESENDDEIEEIITNELEYEYSFIPHDFDIEWEDSDSKVYEVTVTDTATYRIRANSEGEARNQAWDWFNEREPSFDIKVVEGKADDEL